MECFDTDIKAFGERLKEFRSERKMSQTELADLVGLRYSHISRYENGGSKPSAEMLMKLSKALNTSIDFLLFGKEENVATADFEDKELLVMFKKSEKLPEDEKAILKKFIGLFFKEKQFKQLANSEIAS